MRNITLKVTLLLLVATYAQDLNAQVGAIRGSNSGQIGAGFTDTGILVNGYFSRNFDDRLRGLFGGGFSFSEVATNVTHYAIYVDAIGSYAMYSANRGAFKLNAQAGINFAFDILDAGDTDLSSGNLSFNPGMVGGLEAEFSVSKGMSFALASNIRYFIKEDFGQVRYQNSVGLRFLLGR